MSLINWEINLISILSANCVISNAPGETKFAKAHNKRHFPVVALSIQGNTKLLQL